MHNLSSSYFLYLREDIQNSLVLEKAVGTIYNAIYGLNGKRGVEFVRRVLSYLTYLEAEAEADLNDVSQYEEVLYHLTEEIISTSLQIQEVTFISEFKEVVEKLCGCSILNDAGCYHTSPIIRLARENLSKVQDIIGTGDGFTSHGQRARRGTSQGQQSQPALAVDFPGTLSQSGIRHNNDHASISDIRFLPTLAEIWYSQRLTFSPQEMYCIL